MDAGKLTDKQWLEEMTLELRLRNVRGEAIGDAVAEVETYCDESGETPYAAFGDPREYARALDFGPPQLSNTSFDSWMKILPIASGLVGTSLVPGVVRAVSVQTSVTIGWGELAGLALLAVVVAVSVTFLRSLLQNTVGGILFFGGAVTVMAMVPGLIPGTAFTLRLSTAVALTIGCLTASVLGMWWQRHALHDPVVDPRAPEHDSRLPQLATIWLFPVLAVLIGAITAVPLLFTT